MNNTTISQTVNKENVKPPSVKYTCECGSTITVKYKKRHEQTVKHIVYMHLTYR